MSPSTSPPRPSVQASLPRILAATAEVVCQGYAVLPGTRELLEPNQSPLELLDRLVATEERYPDAVMFLAHALEPRFAVWWGCLCVWHYARTTLNLAEIKTLAGAVAWVLEPNEATRQQAEALTVPVSDGVASKLAAAAAATGGSTVTPPSSRVGDLVASALVLTPPLGGMEAILPTYRRIIALGIRVAQGHYHFKREEKKPARQGPFWPGQTI